MRHLPCAVGVLTVALGTSDAVPEVMAMTAQVESSVPDAVASAGVDDAVNILLPAIAGGDPHDKPGAQLGPRSSAELLPEANDLTRDWFGGAPPWEWSRLTGDWAGARTWLEEHGVTIEGSFTIEWADAISGGIGRKWIHRNYFDINAAFDTEKLVGWQGGKFYVEVASSYTQDGGVFVPVTQWTSNIEVAEDTFQIANLWYEQRLFDTKLRLKAGKIDASTEFGFLDATDGFLNLSALLPPTVASVPWYPYSGLGGVAYFYPCDNFYVGGGAFDATDVVAGFVREDSFDEVWIVGETGITWNALGGVHDGRASFGGWWDSRELDRFDGNGQSTSWGLYAVAQQRLWRPDDSTSQDERGVWLFGQLGYADPDVGAITGSYAGGVALHGTFPGRDVDQTGFYISSAHFAGGSGMTSNETVFELFYGLQLTPAVKFTPNIQFIVHPNGDDAATNPIVFTMRIELSF
ncbi:MAG: carbohydrate porin [Phycisphaerae bacterium]|nr:carbohydrate porin [Phycisphaerae bacterium]